MDERVVNEDSPKKEKRSPFSGFYQMGKSNNFEKDSVLLSLNYLVPRIYVDHSEGNMLKSRGNYIQMAHRLISLLI